MRTTLTLDDDLAKELHKTARDGGRSFKEWSTRHFVTGLPREHLRRGARAGFEFTPRHVGFAVASISQS
jgi:hypothetical protein